MNRKILSIIVAGGLSLTAGVAFAQSSSAQQPPPTTGTMPPPNTQNGPTGANGSTDMNGGANGSDMNAGANGSMNGSANMQSSSTPPSFSTLDTQGNGYLTQQDASQNSWLGMHWAQCDADHNGQVSQAEYQACSQQQ